MNLLFIIWFNSHPSFSKNHKSILLTNKLYKNSSRAFSEKKLCMAWSKVSNCYCCYLSSLSLFASSLEFKSKVDHIYYINDYLINKRTHNSRLLSSHASQIFESLFLTAILCGHYSRWLHPSSVRLHRHRFENEHKIDGRRQMPDKDTSVYEGGDSDTVSLISTPGERVPAVLHLPCRKRRKWLYHFRFTPPF